MSLEQYMFPYGKREVAVKERLRKRLAHASAALCRRNHELGIAHEHIDHCHKEIAEMQLRDVRPIVDYMCEDMDVTVDTYYFDELKAQEFRVGVLIPNVRFQKMYHLNKAQFGIEVINECTRKLSDAITKYILKGIISRET